MSAANALFIAKAQNGKKRVGLKDIYDSDKARKQIDSAGGKKSEPLNLERYRRAQEAMKAYRSNSLGKGG